MKKKSSFMVSVIVILYAAVFFIIMTYAILTPARVYDNLDLLAKNQNSANKINYKISRHEGTTTVTCEKMQGMDIIWEYTADEDMTHQMYYNFDVTSGKAKLVLVQPDGTVITLMEQNGSVAENSGEPATDTSPLAEASMVELKLKKGTNRIKIVCGKGTAFSLSFQISE